MGKDEDENFKQKYEAMKKLNEQQRNRLENLEKNLLKATDLQNQIEQQRNNMNQTTRSVAEDEMSLVESEIAAQREMLKEADTTLNSILNKMEDDVVDVSERDPDIRELRKFLSEQNRQTKEKLQESQAEVDKIEREKRDLEKQFKKYKEEAENQMARMRSQQQSLRKMESPKKVDKRTDEALRNEQVRMALEEKMAEMWQPEARVLDKQMWKALF
ncbi:Oidioi.mRNA.OKI2018_I69.chr2.g7790.t1.cds [Oikopleura dioica]|uniref:Oidioi.mRNA.OKI2018_I69.chr2.g7790.t1.cds n=1 Tax=Oikopleura dioica TaxID=34765 RepID=A0ABN7T9N4_OIKDI|nr:Oidioi.mRNA.OKI2018_I69.chr2.g7790.t1.cds [Oikopleura dioica]